MEKYMLERSPSRHSFSNQECEELFTTPWEMDKIKSLESEPDAVFYWYVSGCYEGSGFLLATKDGKWCEVSLSHCSCYGPLENFPSSISEYKISSLKEVLNNATEDYASDVRPLIELARSYGYE